VSEENYLSDLNAGVQGRGRDLVYKYGVSFPLTLYFQPEDDRIRPKHVVGKLLYLQI